MSVEGQLQIGGNPFEASCTCAPNSNSFNKSQCNPQGFTVMIDRKVNNDADPKLVERFIGPLNNLTWTKITETHFADIDGRNTKAS